MTAALAQFAVSTVTSDDLELVHASKEGDVSAFEQLVWRYDRKLLFLRDTTRPKEGLLHCVFLRR